MIKQLVITLTALVAMALMSSCEHKELCYDHPHSAMLNVVFDWSLAPEAEESVDAMAVYLFPDDGTPSLRYDFTNLSGGRIKVPCGSYRVMCLNSDIDDVDLLNTLAWPTFQLALRTTSLFAPMAAMGVRAEYAPRAQGTEQERVVFSPQPLWSDRLTDVDLSDIDVNEHTITLVPVDITCHYTVEILNASNLKYVDAISASISSMAGSYFPTLLTAGPELVTMPFGLSTAQARSTVSGEFYTFGLTPAEAEGLTPEVAHHIMVYAVLSDGARLYYPFNVTDQVVNAPDPRNVHIVIDGLPLPKPIVNGGGFQPEVDEWDPIYIDLEM